MAPPKVLRHRQQHQPDHALDRMIAAHRRKHTARMNMLGVKTGDMLARYIANHHRATRAF